MQNILVQNLLTNEGQLKDVPANPRFIRDERFVQLKRSIKDFPEMLDLRPPIVIPFNKKYVVLCGNMRVRAAKELGHTQLKCEIIEPDTPATRIREIIIKDNIAFGQDDHDALSNEWDEFELLEWGMQLPIFEEAIEEEEQQDELKEIKLTVEHEDSKEIQQLFIELAERGFTCKVK